MKRICQSLILGAVGFLFFSRMTARSGVVVAQTMSKTNWTAGAQILTVPDPPAVTATVSENNFGTLGVAQTFSPITNLMLTNIQILVSGTAQTFNLHLYDLGAGQTSGNPSPYSAGADLFTGLQLTINSSASAFVINFAFTGADQVLLVGGHKYAFELEKVSGGPITWRRTAADTYSGGDAYRDRSLLNGGGSLRDFALAVFGTPVTNPPPAPVAAQCTINWNDTRQVIEGCGGGTVFLNPASLSPVTDAHMNTLFSSTNASQLGLTLLRIRISPNGNWANDLADAKKAKARGARIIAAPWSPPAAMKDNNHPIGGSLLPAQYANYANYLNNFGNHMATNGASLAMISVQNEPDITVTYESCDWTPAQLQTFFHNNAGAITSAPVMMPESYQFNFSFSDPTLNDPVAVTNVAAVGGHLYGFNQVIQDYPNAHNKGKRTWMTEYLVNDQTWSAALTTAQQMHQCLTTANMSAYIWWKCLGDTNGLVNASGVPQKRGFVMSQFSRFVRPGFVRIGVTNNTGPLLISAYKNLTNGNFAFVVINPTTSNIDQTFNLSGFLTTNVKPWITSETLSLSNQTSLAVSGTVFTNTIPALSVVTLIGQTEASNSAPTGISLSNASVGENQPVGTVVGNLSTTDPDANNTFSYSLVNGVGGADNARFAISNAVLKTAAILNFAVQSAPGIRVRSTDQGGLSTDESFAIQVLPDIAARRIVAVERLADGNVRLTFAGVPGYSYAIETATNLRPPIIWQALTNQMNGGTSFSPGMDGSWIYTDIDVTNHGTRFYRTREP